MQKMYKPFRIGILFTIVAVMVTIYIMSLYRMQIVDARPADEIAYGQGGIRRTVPLVAARGNIYDRNGVLLASGRTSNNITLNRLQILRSPNPNDTIRELLGIAVAHGVRHNDTFPVTFGPPFAYLTNMNTQQRARLNAFIEFHTPRGLYADISASDLLAWMRGHYGIDYTIGITEARLIMGIRYELEMRVIMGHLAPYVFANDVPRDFVSIVEERRLIGVNIEHDFAREYHTPYAAHILGNTGRIPEALMERYVYELGYPRDARIGRSGAEQAFEQYLRGINGEKVVTHSRAGTVIDVEITSEPQPGHNVFLTICIDLQAAAERYLSEHITRVNTEERDDTTRITGGSVVATDVRTGEVLASVSYPTFDINTLSQMISELNQDPDRPLFNRATHGIYQPGSSFKMVSAFVGLREGTISRWTQFNCAGRFERWADADGGGFRPACWIFNVAHIGHGPIDVVPALAASCNKFFFYAADNIGTRAIHGGEALAAASLEFGLGQPTGVQISESAGILGDQEFKYRVFDEYHRTWVRADTVLTSFGQGHHHFTPLQLANYTATIANGGTRNYLTLLRQVRNNDMSEVLYRTSPRTAYQFDEAYAYYMRILREGMIAASRPPSGTARSVFEHFRIPVASKTGTVQVEGLDYNNAVFVAYAPVQNPEIAIAAVIEQGGSGAAIMGITRDIFDHYFTDRGTTPMTTFGDLIP